MAPAIKELSRWLDANAEYYVAPDWADVVKHSVSMIHCNNVCQSLMTSSFLKMSFFLFFSFFSGLDCHTVIY